MLPATIKRNFVQYARRSIGFVPIGETIQTLEPGHYDIASDNGVLIFAKRNVNTDKIIRLSDSKSDDVVKQIEHFWTLKDKFKSYGLIYKRGVLLYGPPGSGKTSTITIISEKMIENGGLVINGTSTNPANLKKMLLDLRDIEPERPLVVTLEDLENTLKLDESTMLALLDGDANIGNVVFIATTNYPEKLEARIINRPSRFDVVVRIGMPSRDARRQYILHCDPTFGHSASTFEMDLWLDLTDNFSIAQLKEAIISVKCFDHNIEETVQRIRSGSLAISEKAVVKANRNRTFFEKFYETCERKMTPADLKALRDITVNATVADKTVDTSKTATA